MLQGLLQRWLTAAGITKKITFHCTRHSFGSLHVEMGTDMAVIQAYLGHKNITTTQIYSKIAAQQMCQVVDKITLKRKGAYMAHIDRFSEGRLWLQGYNRPSMFLA